MPQIKFSHQVLLWLMGGLALVWSIVVWDGQRTEEQALENARRETAAWAMTFASQAQSIFAYTDHALLTLRDTWIEHPADMGDMVRMHKDAQGGSILQVGVIDARGYLVYSNLGLPKEPSFLGDREHFTVHQALMEDRLFVSRPVKGRVSGKWSIQLTRPIFLKGQFAGVIVISVDPDYFVRFYRATGFGSAGAARMVRDTGEVMARSSEQDKYVGNVIQPVPYADPGAPLQGSFRRRAQADGVERLSSYYRLPQYGLTLLVGSSVDEFLAPVREQQRKSFLAAAVVSLLLILLACLLIRSVARQMKAHQAVLESEERFRMIFDMLPIGISLGDQQGNVMDCNAAAERLLGVSRAQFMARDPSWKVLRPDGSPMPASEYATERALAEQRPVLDVSMEVRTPDGHGVWLSANATPVHHPRYGVVGAFVDISDRVRAESEMRQVMQAAGEIIWLSDSAGCFTFVNTAVCELLDYSLGEMLAMRVSDLLADEDLGGLQATVDALEGEAFVRREWWLKRKGWGTVLVEIVSQRLEKGRYLSIGHEIGERKRAEHKLQLAASVFTHAREGIMITDARGTIVDVNDTFTRITGYSRDEALGQNPRILNSGRQPPEYYSAMWQTLMETGQWSGEVWNRRKSGEVFAEMQTVSAVRDPAGAVQNYVALFSDITPMKEHQQELEHIAHYDALTHLPNRVLLADRLQQAIHQSLRRHRSLAVVFLDLDGFKAVNDRHGHAMGDSLLIALSERMKGALREGDTLARIGGDEFVAILADLEMSQDCEPVLERLLGAASGPVEVANTMLQVSASMGVTVYPQDGSDADLLMRHADQAMYAAKQAGKNRYHLFDVAQEAAVRSRRESLERIREALTENEFVLYYQPKVDIRNSIVVGVEALIRWRHPERGLLLPSEFLPVIEDHPISVELGEWVIHSALTQIAIWQKSGLNIPVSVNIGALQLQRTGFAGRLKDILRSHPDVPAHRLELEVLETSAVSDIGEVSQIMHDCRVHGVQFALDDFGTGYSSLTYLKHLPAEMIKIDQSFVRDMLSDADDMAIVRGIIGLAAAFGRRVIAEGVETAAHSEQLLALGCELAQGFGIARPMPAGDVPAWVTGWRTDPACVI